MPVPPVAPLLWAPARAPPPPDQPPPDELDPAPPLDADPPELEPPPLDTVEPPPPDGAAGALPPPPPPRSAPLLAAPRFSCALTGAARPHVPTSTVSAAAEQAESIRFMAENLA
jgi:hypothetical protein